MRRGGQASLDLASLALGSSHAITVLWVTFVNGGCVNVLIVVGLEAEEPLIFGELVPSSSTSRWLLQAAIDAIVGVGNPWLEGSLGAGSVVGNSGIGSEPRSSACSTISIMFLQWPGLRKRHAVLALAVSLTTHGRIPLIVGHIVGLVSVVDLALRFLRGDHLAAVGCRGSTGRVLSTAVPPWLPITSSPLRGRSQPTLWLLFLCIRAEWFGSEFRDAIENEEINRLQAVQ